MLDQRCVDLRVNGRRHRLMVESRRTLADVLREELGLTGTHLACEHGVCGACTVAIDGRAVRSCLMLALQADGCEVETVESLAVEGALHAIQASMAEAHAFQCAFCAPGFLMTIKCLLDSTPRVTRAEIMAELAGNLCRCTGYTSIIDGAVAAAAAMLDGARGQDHA